LANVVPIVKLRGERILYAHTVSDLWTPRQLDAIERRYPTDEVRALLAEIRRLDTIAVRRRSRAIALLVSRAKALITNASRGAIDYESYSRR
jgi:hypothetical protein